MNRTGIAIAMGVGLAICGALRAEEVPTPVAPGTPGGIAVVRGTCPTFHWSEVERARGYALALFRLGSNGETAEELYRIRLPRGAQGWTPTVEHCLEPGHRYGWALRALGSDQTPGPWSGVRLFEIATAPTAVEVEEALVVLRRWIESDRSEGNGEISEDPVPPSIAAPESSGSAPRSRPELSAEMLEAFAEHLHASPEGEEPPTVEINAAAPVLGIPGLTFDQQLHLGGASDIFKGDKLLFWEDGSSQITSMGREALMTNTTGERNTAFGFQALTDSTTGEDNTGLGNKALTSNTTGRRNTGIGSIALRDNTSGNFNTALGWEALAENTTGSFNTALGFKSMHESDTGNNNTGIGVEAIGTNTTGSDNTAVGFAAMHDNTTGWRNTALGARALRVTSTGEENTAVGKDALLASVTGSRNTAVGILAGATLATGDDNIYLGSGAVGLATESNTIRIGGPTVGTGAGEQNRAYLNGVTGINVTGVAVLVASDGQLGVTVSSRRYKEAIRDMEERSSRLLALRPVTFHYRDGATEGPKPVEYGLIAEEVAAVFPELVAYDALGRPSTVKYHLLSTLLLNELQALETSFRALDDEVEALRELSLRQSLETGALRGSTASSRAEVSGDE